MTMTSSDKRSDYSSTSSSRKRTRSTSCSSSSSSSSPSGKGTLSVIPNDIMIARIFILLPFAAIFQLRGVCKGWLSLLSDPGFISRWINLHDVSLPMFVYDSIKTKPLISYQSSMSLEFVFATKNKPFPKRLYLLGSSNGLVLGASSQFRAKHYYVINPLTKEWIELPLTPASTNIDYITVFTFESKSSPGCYKVVRIPMFKENTNVFKIQVFSSDLGKWEVFDVLRHKDVVRHGADFDSLVIASNFLNWIECGKMVAYNLNRNGDNETGGRQCRLIDLPISKESCDESINCLGESEGLLLFAVILTGTLSVWVFEENWRLLHDDIELRDLVATMFRKVNECNRGDLEGEDIEWEDEYAEQENAVIEEVKIVGFNPVDKNSILLKYKYVIWAFNMETSRYEELAEHSFVDKKHSYLVRNPFVIKARPTLLPPATWKKT